MTCHNRIILPYICLSYAMVVSEKHLNTAGNYVKYMQLHPLLEKTSTKKIRDMLLQLNREELVRENYAFL